MKINRLFIYLNLLTIKNLRNYIKIGYERFLGLDFSLIVSAEESGLDPNLSYRSSPTNSKDLKKILGVLRITDRDSILDIGCGKGKALYTMLNFPFLKVDGIELSEKISEIAKKNISLLNKTDRCNVFLSDAREFKNYKDYNIFYFYNPFPCEIMKTVISEIAKTIKVDSEVIIIYNNPTCKSEIERVGLFTEIAIFKSEWDCEIKVFSTFSKETTRCVLNV